MFAFRLPSDPVLHADFRSMMSLSRRFRRLKVFDPVVYVVTAFKPGVLIGFEGGEIVQAGGDQGFGGTHFPQILQALLDHDPGQATAAMVRLGGDVADLADRAAAGCGQVRIEPAVTMGCFLSVVHRVVTERLGVEFRRTGYGDDCITGGYGFLRNVSLQRSDHQHTPYFHAIPVTDKGAGSVGVPGRQVRFSPEHITTVKITRGPMGTEKFKAIPILYLMTELFQ